MALRLSVIYAVASSLWIVLSDRALGWLGLPRPLELDLASVKGLAFVIVTATLLCLLALRFAHGLQESQERYARLFENAVEGLTVYQVVRGDDGVMVDLELTDMNPTQARRTNLARDAVVGRRLSEPDGLDERTHSYLDLVANAARSRGPARSELYVQGDDAYELLEAYPIGRDRWALAAMDITEVRHAEQAMRREEEGIRRAYVDVLDAVTGGKLILLTEDELAGQLEVPLTDSVAITAPEQLSVARRRIVAAAGARFPQLQERFDLTSPACEAMANTLNHADGGTYRLFASDRRLQVLVSDAGPGIDFRTLPRATLVAGFSTAESLGLGFTIMLQSCSRVLLSTRPGRTTVVLEFATDGAPAPAAAGASGLDASAPATGV